MRALAGVVGAAWRGVLDFWLPSFCAACGVESGAFVCEGCLGALVPEVREHSVAGMDGVVSCYAYEGVVRRMLTRFKLEGDLGVGGLLRGVTSGLSVCILAGSFEPAGLPSWAYGPAGQPGPDLPFRQGGPAVPSLSLLTLERPTRVQTGDFCWMEVPSHFSRVRERGFRHVWFLWEGWMNCLSLPFSDTLCRVKETRPLYELDPEARRAEVAQAFSCSADLTGKTVILADDILTTGATLSEIAAVLRGRGAARVYGICICRA